MPRLARSIALTLAALFLGGCVFSLGGGSTERHQRATLGEELSALKEAHDSGAISDKEYDEARKELLDSAKRR